MTPTIDGPLCFVVTRNHGSLIDAVSFLQGTQLLERSVLLLPPELTATHEAPLNARAHEYEGYSDLIRWIDIERPSLVFLCSGYLLTAEGLVSARQLRRFVNVLESRGCVVVTNDPCWGLIGATLRMTSVLPTNTIGERLLKAWVEWLIPHRLRQACRVLRHLVHCYPAPVGEGLTNQGIRTLSYFNPQLITSVAESDGQIETEGGGLWSRPTERTYWVFILASLDYRIQITLHGESQFIDTLTSQIRDTNAAGRHAVLIAPEACLSAVRDSLEPGDATLISFCDYQQYVSLLLFAEYAFYWNAASSSSIYRLVNRLPVFCFDRGHVSRWFEGFYERTVEFLYAGHPPVMLDQRETLSAGRLHALAETYRIAAKDAVRELEALPTPEEVTARLLQSGQVTPAGYAEL